MPTTSVPSMTFTPTGPSVPAEGAVLNGVFADMNAAFGGGMSTSLSSPQGQLAQSFTAIIGDANDNLAALVNLVNPDTASGIYQDALARIYFLDRIAASGTIVAANCVGLAGTVIPAGSLAQDTAGNNWISLTAATIPAGGTISVQFQCLTNGPVACAIGALSVIVKAVTGWESVSNPAAATVLGTNEESRADFEYRRKQSVAANAVNSIQSIRAAVLAVPDVLDAYVTDNSTNATVNTGPTAYPLIANSVYVCTAGGTSANIAAAIWSKKSLGCSYNGNTSYTYTDTSGGVTPYPTYTIKYQVATQVPIYFKVSIVNSTSLPSNIVALVQNAIIAAFNGTDGGTRARIASELYAGRYYPGIGSIDPSVQLLSVYLGTAANPTTTQVTMGIEQQPTISAANIQVVLV